MLSIEEIRLKISQYDVDLNFISEFANFNKKNYKPMTKRDRYELPDHPKNVTMATSDVCLFRNTDSTGTDYKSLSILQRSLLSYQTYPKVVMNRLRVEDTTETVIEG